MLGPACRGASVLGDVGGAWQAGKPHERKATAMDALRDKEDALSKHAESVLVSMAFNEATGHQT